MGDRLASKVTIVTGAGSGIGRATPIRFAEEGARVTCVDVNEDAVRETAAGIGNAAFAVAGDVSDPRQVQAWTDGTVERWGGLHVVFNNAGIFHAKDESVTTTPEDIWDMVIEPGTAPASHSGRALGVR